MKSRNLRSCLLFVSAGLTCISVGFSKEKEEIPSPPPLAKPGVVSVYLNESAEIPLQIGGRVVEPLSFLIRKGPQHGTLSDLQRTGRNTAIVIYTPEPHAGPGDDTFSFAAKSTDSPVSAPAIVRIRLVERPAVLDLPGEINFGTVYLGDSGSRMLELRNSGGGTASGIVRANPPWRTTGTGEFSLPSGSKAVVPLSFEPSEEREFTERIRVGSDPKSVVLLKGSGVSPISWTRGGVVFQPGDREQGVTTITFTNATSVERALTVTWPDFLKAPKQLTLPTNGSLEVKLEIQSSPPFSYDGAAEILSGNFKTSLPIKVFPAPAKLTVSPSPELKLGAAQGNRQQKGRFIIRNVGGSDASLQIITPPEIVVFPDPSNVILKGGQELTFEAQMENAGPEFASKTIRIQSPACPPLELMVKSTAATPDRAAVSVGKFLNMPAVPLSQTPTSSIKPVASTKVLSSETHRVELSWNLPSPKVSGFRIERRRVSSGRDGQVVVEWLPWPEVKIALSHGTALARFERLPSNAFWTIRIIALDENGLPGLPSENFKVATQPAKHLHIPDWAWVVVLLAISGLVAHLWRRQQGQLRAKEDVRLARLEKE